MLMTLAGLLLLAWIVALLFKVTFGAIHLLLVAAVIIFAIGAFRRNAPRTPTGTGTGTPLGY